MKASRSRDELNQRLGATAPDEDTGDYAVKRVSFNVQQILSSQGSADLTTRTLGSERNI